MVKFSQAATYFTDTSGDVDITVKMMRTTLMNYVCQMVTKLNKYLAQKCGTTFGLMPWMLKAKLRLLEQGNKDL